ncbi:hypothetical protein MGSAQ_003025 [marine sediment metagenome]|uniref:Uncharacterized protein n=1 Tax=marine sediment metagenome TaxID=412755 RepID=A0A1B6NPX3_9ZZZZ
MLSGFISPCLIPMDLHASKDSISCCCHLSKSDLLIGF